MKYILGAVAVVVLLSGIWFFFLRGDEQVVNNVSDSNSTEIPNVSDDQSEAIESTDEVETEINDSETVIGTSLENRPITAYHFGEGEKEVLFIGGIHGGYSWNTSALAYEFVDYLAEDPKVVPEGIRVTIIPVMNPDGLAKTTGKDGRVIASDVPKTIAERTEGRFNARGVDLNRNFDCEWQETALWQSKTVSGGDEVFSEPESKAVRDYVLSHSPVAAVVWYSAVGGVFASNCGDGVSKETADLTATYASASGYKAYQEFNFYEITGDMVNWFAKNDIPGISVLLTDHDNTEWSKNRAGINALLNYIAKE